MSRETSENARQPASCGGRRIVSRYLEYQRHQARLRRLRCARDAPRLVVNQAELKLLDCLLE